MEQLSLLQSLLQRAASRPLSEHELAELNALNTGLSKLMAMKVTHLGPDRAQMEAPVGPGVHQPWGVANGGFYASLAESIGSLASVLAAGGQAVGVNNSTDFIKPVSSGVVIATATAVQLGRRTHIFTVDMHHGEELVARSTLRTMVL